MRVSTAATHPCQEKNAPGFTAFERLCRIQTLILRADLDPQELAVMSEIWARSVGFGKSGVYLGTKQIADRRQMARSTVCEVLNRLELHGMVTRRRGRHRNWLQIEFDGIGDSMALGTKGRKKVEEAQEGVRQPDSEVSVPRTADNLNQNEAEPEVCAATPRRIAAVAEFNLRHADKPVTGTTLAKTWKVAWTRSNFALHTPATDLTPKQRGQLAHLRKPWPWDQKELHFFLAWVITDWRRVMRELSWLKRKPEQPDPGFVLAMNGPLMDLWAAKVRYDFTADLSNDRLDRLMAGGLTEGEALATTTRQATTAQPREEEQRRESEAAWGTRPPVPWRNR